MAVLTVTRKFFVDDVPEPGEVVHVSHWPGWSAKKAASYRARVRRWNRGVPYAREGNTLTGGPRLVATLPEGELTVVEVLVFTDGEE